jgi:hypothetical protein
MQNEWQSGKHQTGQMKQVWVKKRLHKDSTLNETEECKDE